MEGAVGGEDPGGGDDVDVGVPEEKVAEGLDGDDEAGLAVGLAGAQAEPGGEGGVRGEIEMAEASAVVAEERAEEAGEGEDDVAVGDGGADGVGDEGTLDTGAALVARGAEAALFTGEGEEEFVVAVGAVQAGEAGVEIAALEEGGDGGGVVGVEGRQRVGVIVEDLPNGGGAGLARAVA